MNSLIFWLILAIVLAGADMVLGTAYLLIIAVAALITCLVSLLNWPILWEIAIFSILGITGCVLLSLKKKKNTYRSVESASKLQNIDIGRQVTINEVRHDGHAKVFYRGAVWEAAPAQGFTLQKGLWTIVALDGNLLILKPKETK